MGGTRLLILGAVAIVLVVVAGFTLFGGSPEVKVTGQYKLYGVCLACQQSCEVEYDPGERAPHRCPNCGEKAVYPWFFCNECKRRFVPHLVPPEADGPPRVPPVGVICTECRSPQVTQFIPQAMTEEPVGDAPLPAWP